MKISLSIILYTILFGIKLLQAQNCGTVELSNFNCMVMNFAKENHSFQISKQDKLVSISTVLKSGQEVKLFYTCRNDTMFVTRNDLMIDEKTGLIMVYGMQAYPIKLKVGDRIEPSRDFLIQSPISKEGFNLVTTAKSDYFISGNQSFILSTIKTYNIQSKTQISMNTEYLNYVNAKVVAEEIVKIEEQNFKAYKIDYEQWTKPSMNISLNYNTDGMNSKDEQAQVRKQEEQTNKLLQKKLSKLSKEMTNKEGYIITPKTDWYVPGIGIVKTIFYNEGRMFEKDKAYIVSLKK